MAIGGYKIIDLKDTNLVVNGVYVIIHGLYEEIEGNYRKATLLDNVVINGVERNARYVVFGVSNSNFVANIAISDNVNILMLTVTADDHVTLTEL